MPYAFSAAKPGDTIVMVANCTDSTESYLQATGTDHSPVILDMNGFTLTETGNHPAIQVDPGCCLVIKGEGHVLGI